MSKDIHRVYLAAPVVTDDSTKAKVELVYDALMKWNKELAVPFDIYRPGLHKVPNEWGIPMETWGQCVFTMDVIALEAADWVVLCDFGRNGLTVGTAWECGYAFSKGKKIFVVHMPGVGETSLMINGCAANEIEFDKLLAIDSVADYRGLFVERGRLPAKRTLN